MLGRVDRALLLLCSIDAVALAACSGPVGQTCAVDSDCASPFCKADGTCGPAPIDASLVIDAAPDGTSALCNPNHDGSISLAELTFIAGRMGTFRIATNATWNTAGQSMQNGSRKWDLSGQLSGDADRV